MVWGLFATALGLVFGYWFMRSFDPPDSPPSALSRIFLAAALVGGVACLIGALVVVLLQ